MAPVLTGVLLPKRAPWQCVPNLVCAPPPPLHPHTIGNPPTPAAATSLFTRCRGSGVATSHVSREPDAPGRVPRAGRARGGRAELPRPEELSVFLPAPSRAIWAVNSPDPERGSGASAPQSQLHVGNQPFGPAAPPPPAGSPQEYF